jgi:hypothetical protein
MDGHVVKLRAPLLAAAAGIAAGASLAAPALAQTAPVSLTPQGAWRVGAVPNQQGGFDSCAAVAALGQAGEVQVRRRPDGQTILTLGLRDGGFAAGQQQQVQADIDGALTRTLSGVAPQPQVLIIGGIDDAFLDGFARGSAMNVRVGARQFRLALRGTGRAVADLRDCVRTRGQGSAPPVQQAQAAPAPAAPAQAAPAQQQPAQAAPAPGRPPQAQAGGQPAQERPPVAATREVTILPPPLINLLIQAGMQNAQPLVLDQVPPEQRPGEHAWRFGPVVGSLQETRIPPEVGFRDAIDRTLQTLSGGCTDEAATSVGDPSVIGGVTLATGQLRCTTAEGPIHAALLMYQTPERVFVRFMHYGPTGEAERADQARAAVEAVVRRTAEAAASRAPSGGPAAAPAAPAQPAPAQPSGSAPRAPAQPPAR